MMNKILEYLLEPTKIKWIVFWFVIALEILLLISLKIRRAIKTININKKAIESANNTQSELKNNAVITISVEKIPVEFEFKKQTIKGAASLKTELGQSNEDWRIETEQNQVSTRMGVL